jgi:hypothetical protein
MTNDVNNIKMPGNIAMLVICVILIPVFVLWERRQERLGKPALIPNSLWRNSVFTNVCLMVMFSWAVINVMELYCSLLYVLLFRTDDSEADNDEIVSNKFKACLHFKPHSASYPAS